MMWEGKNLLRLRVIRSFGSVAIFACNIKESELEKVMEEINLDEVNIIECMIDHDDGAYPMVAAGSSINNIIDRDQMY